LTLPLKRAEIGPILIAAVARISVSESFSRLSQPGIAAFSTAGSFKASQTIWRGAGMRRSPVMSIQSFLRQRRGQYGAA
jgi:hypothetical protein